MIKRRVIFYLCLILIISGVVWSGFLIWGEGEPDVWRVYEGRLYLVEEEYEQFKQYLADNPDIRIIKLDVYSPPNALIEVELEAPANIDVPYGEMTREFDSFRGNSLTRIVLPFVFHLFLLAFSLAIFYVVWRVTIYPRWI